MYPSVRVAASVPEVCVLMACVLLACISPAGPFYKIFMSFYLHNLFPQRAAPAVPLRLRGVHTETAAREFTRENGA